MRIDILTLFFLISIFSLSLNGQESHSEKCDISIILEMHQNIENVSEDLMFQFLKTFGPECKNNVEFSEFSNETLFKVIQNEPELFCKVLENNQNLIDFETILGALKSPLHDLIDLELTIIKIADTKVSPALKSQLIITINSANWDESKKIEQFKKPTLLFFHPDSVQFRELAKSKNSEGLYEVSSDFGFYANKIIELYQDSTLNVTITDKRLFIASNELIDKFEQKSPYGLILIKNHEYKIETGVFTDIGLQQMINEYFKEE